MLGDNIKKYRKENNISQEVLGEKLGVSRQSISLWENNQTQPSLENIVALANIFNISTDDLLLSTKEGNVEEVNKEDKIANNVTPQPKVNKKLLIWILVAVCTILVAVVLLFLKPWSSDSIIPRKPFSEDVDAIAKKEASVVKVFCYDHNGKEIATGSGVVLFHNDMIVTNYHVIEDAYSVKISTDQDITYNVSGLWHENENQDIAILKLEKNTDLTPLQIGNSSAVKKGETVTAIGSPLGIKNTVSKGNLSARIMQDGYDVLQFTAPISNGSSGGALFNEKGEVIGITFASFVEGQNLNLAIPIELVDNLYQSKSLSIEPTSFEDIYSSDVKTYSVGETWVVDGQWEFTIHSARKHYMCSEYSDHNDMAQCVIITYSYKNLGYAGHSQDLYISAMSFDVYDAEGEAAAEIYFCTHTKRAKVCSVGTKCSNAQEAYALYNNSSQLTLIFEHYTSNGLGTQKATFVIPVS